MYSRGNKNPNFNNNISKHVLEVLGKFICIIICVLNRMTSIKSGVTSYEIYYGAKPNIENFQVLGSKAYVHIPRLQETKTRPESRNMLVCSEYYKGTKECFFWNKTTRKFIRSQDVTFE